MSFFNQSTENTQHFTDFRFAECEKTEGLSWWRGTLPYLIPEITRGEKYVPQVDLHSVKILIY